MEQITDVNGIYNELATREKEICEVMFKAITGKSIDGKLFKRSASAKEIKEIAGCSSDELLVVTEKFREFLTPFKDDNSIIGIYDENLIVSWDRLKEWIDDEAASALMYLRLSEASAMYQQGKATIWRPPDLETAITWRDKYNPTPSWAVRYNPAFERAMVFLHTSEKEYFEEEENKIKLQKRQKRQVRKTKIIALTLAVVAIISLAFMTFAFVKKIAADKQAALAEQLRVLAEKERDRADSLTLEAIAARGIADSNAAIALSNAQQQFERQRILSEYQRYLASQSEAEALKLRAQFDSVIQVDKNIQVVTEQRNIAQRLRMVAISKSMSVRSLLMQGQKDLQSLLAYQAYLFNKNNGGTDNDADIYAALYSVAKNYGNKNYRAYQGHAGGVRGIAFVPDKREFITAGYDGKVIRWAVDRPNQPLQTIYSGVDNIEALAVSPDASWLAMGGADAAIKMISLKGEQGYEMKGSGGVIKSLVFSIDSKSLYSASVDGIALKWDIASRTSENFADGITNIDISFNGKFMAGINTTGEAIVWNMDNRADNFRIATRNIKSIRFNSNNDILALGDVRGNVELWDVGQRRMITEVKAHDDQINDIRFNGRLNQMATASNDKSFKIFNMADLTEPPVALTDFEGLVTTLKFSPDGEFIISGSYEERNNLVSRPAHVDGLAGDICGIVSRNMTQDEWNIYVGRDIPLEKTCPEREQRIIIRPLTVRR